MKALCSRLVSLAVIVAMLAVYACGVFVPAAAAESQTYDLYFDNSDGWDEVYAYYWADGNTGMVAWPGVATENQGGSIYSVHLPAEAQYVIFNNKGQGGQTEDLTVPGTGYVYSQADKTWSVYTACAHQWQEKILKAATCSASGSAEYTCSLCGESYEKVLKPLGHRYSNGKCAICGGAEPEVLEVYFDNTDNWDQVYVYFWSDNDVTMTTWPGEQTVHEGGSVYSAQLPVNAKYVIFNNHGQGIQTVDLQIPETSYIYSWGEGTWSAYVACDHVWQEKVLQEVSCSQNGLLEFTCDKCGESYQETVKRLPHSYEDGICTGCGEEEPEFYTIYFDNTDGWEQVSAYYWSDIPTDEVQWPQWPGIAMTHMGGSIYSIQLPDCAEYVIFTNGTVQTMDMWIPGNEYVYSWATAYWEEFRGCFHEWGLAGVIWELSCTQGGLTEHQCTLCGNVYTNYQPPLGHDYADGACTRCAEPEPADPMVYFDNALNWETVYIYYWAEKNADMIAWPGIEMTVADGGYSAQIPWEAEYVIFTGGTDLEQSPDMWLPGDGFLFCMFSMEWKPFDGCYHTWQYVEGEGGPTCTDYGFENYVCSVCSNTCAKFVEALGHDYVDSICTRCGKSVAEDLTVYFDNANYWETVYVYFWSEKNVELTVWPGVEMIAMDGGCYAKISGEAEYVIFSDGTNVNQTADMWLPGDGWFYSAFLDEWSEFQGCFHDWQWDSWSFAPTCISFGFAEYVCTDCDATCQRMANALGHEYVDGACVRCDYPEPEMFTVYFENTAGWTDVYVYFWPDYEAGSDPNWYYPTWPGQKMTLVRDNIYSITLPEYAAYLNFSDGRENTSDDLTIPGGNYLYSWDKKQWSEFTVETGVSIGGKVESFLNAAGEITIALSPAEGVSEVVAQTVVTGNTATYLLEDVAPGTYTLVISKAGHVTRSYTVTVEGEDVTLDLKICPLGDATGDGKVNVVDTARAYTHTKGGQKLEGYNFACADASGDGKLNVRDVAQIYAHVKGNKSLW